MVKIRMARGGRKNRPVYTIVATNSLSLLNGKLLKKLGQYDPKANEAIKFVNVEGIKTWLGKGAQLSDTVRTLLKNNKITL